MAKPSKRAVAKPEYYTPKVLEGPNRRAYKLLRSEDIEAVLATANHATASKKFMFEDNETPARFAGALQQHFLTNYPTLMCRYRVIERGIIAWVEPRHPLTERTRTGGPRRKRNQSSPTPPQPAPPRRRRQSLD